MVERLTKAYNLSSSHQQTVPMYPDLWTWIVACQYGPNSGQPLTFQEDYFIHYGERNSSIGGFTLGLDGYLAEPTVENMAQATKDSLIKLGEAIGVVQLATNEPVGSLRKQRPIDVEDLITKIEQSLGIDISLPPVIHTVGLETSKGVFHYRHVNALYAAYQLKRTLEVGKAWPETVLEIGGGLGIVAVYARRLGIKDYTVVDLPFGNAFCGYYLMKVIGEENVVLFGEEERPDTVKVYPSSWQGWKRYGVVLNQDSFPEMAVQYIYGYFDKIYEHSEYLLSINHEQIFARDDFQPLGVSVHHLLKDDIRFEKVYRSRCWVREGYVDELYKRARK